jgi:hypothetical protein
LRFRIGARKGKAVAFLVQLETRVGDEWKPVVLDPKGNEIGKRR